MIKILIAFIIGGCFGVMAMALCVAAGKDNENRDMEDKLCQ